MSFPVSCGPNSATAFASGISLRTGTDRHGASNPAGKSGASHPCPMRTGAPTSRLRSAAASDSGRSSFFNPEFHPFVSSFRRQQSPSLRKTAPDDNRSVPTALSTSRLSISARLLACTIVSLATSS